MKETKFVFLSSLKLGSFTLFMIPFYSVLNLWNGIYNFKFEVEFIHFVHDTLLWDLIEVELFLDRDIPFQRRTNSLRSLCSPIWNDFCDFKFSIHAPVIQGVPRDHIKISPLRCHCFRESGECLAANVPPARDRNAACLVPPFIVCFPVLVRYLLRGDDVRWFQLG